MKREEYIGVDRKQLFKETLELIKNGKDIDDMKVLLGLAPDPDRHTEIFDHIINQNPIVVRYELEPNTYKDLTEPHQDHIKQKIAKFPIPYDINNENALIIYGKNPNDVVSNFLSLVMDGQLDLFRQIDDEIDLDFNYSIFSDVLEGENFSTEIGIFFRTTGAKFNEITLSSKQVSDKMIDGLSHSFQTTMSSIEELERTFFDIDIPEDKRSAIFQASESFLTFYRRTFDVINDLIVLYKIRVRDINLVTRHTQKYRV